jgi:hypothetical protein
VTTYKAGQSFSELPGDRHGVSANASKSGLGSVQKAGPSQHARLWATPVMSANPSGDCVFKPTVISCADVYYVIRRFSEFALEQLDLLDLIVGPFLSISKRNDLLMSIKIT